MNTAEQAAMARARELGLRVLGTTSPNPPVGAVVLDAAGTVVGEGATSPPGGPHAEVHALASAGERARGGTAVVTLEPCAHTGRTGPCADALIAAGVARVVVAVPEPTRLATGGAERLRAAGIDVEVGAEQAAAAEGALAGWLTGVREHRPQVVWKVATTLDGRVAAADGTSRWITGPQARAAVHELRATCDAVLVGSGTALADDPELTVRDADGRPADRQPLRVVLDRRGRVPASARVHDDAAPTLVSRAATPAALLAELFAADVRRVLLEGGPTLAAAFLAAGLVDEAVVHVAPTLLGAGAGMVGGLGISTITDALHLQVTDVTRMGGDVQIRLRPTGHTGRATSTGGGS
ncbi:MULTISPECIES: bifunctional diaminohydroxyphosphoribosylaminopyrimidine deaminase/5-amino-6-(5-phosphoribosylamino)uracil reductase RibD [unclassified Modestobacter]|uniref:bifunctional diaminohydroxyphosphoribosylaminopyrimidine deaminase/5-amino-6-(5-phosphoribosylamino)uracil reductase RibD n=1 Tax=unclassified Modestobacter TaxID=2643866 RepID=UPI0022AAB72C|nr:MULTISPECIES: bifunctional diaminohydroxyphosphoribosylaminopyrimidine deaminase/5-amino-6-(5-phosphoribosylamino)uracil reductase RibD [unclassified Modestobacter]MCZ2824965.1 bifunctional diaminohydroxyphosphoribosylaminopyrimidine deaminase/5-amino-6-(5-phosphoribosylamino)uracil reductase RibD [Modestobacter sp. VKM Ac-2981]MCZ2854532.1 bifunctional diaminohydroxyphosphoribosylaminopyrimidine deaminase/5-amino-6-(5-phosphoribosylamino)uracil reductase RibD [Modestobacter sp. VKM Ac-2982]